MADKKICCLCECPTDFHLNFWSCPLFEGEVICQECCQIETLKTDIDKKFSLKLGKPVSIEEINKQCHSCGMNCAKQNDRLAIKLENGEFNGLNEQ